MKTYIIDTNVLLHDPTCLFAFEENEILIPLVVIEELDKFKTNETEIGRNARTVTRLLDDLRTHGSLHEGVKLSSGGTLRVELNCSESIPINLNQLAPDNRIIGVALGIAKKTENVVIIVSKDINMRVKCDALGVSCQDYKKDRVAAKRDELFTGCVEVDMDDEAVDDFYNGGIIYAPPGLMANEFVLLKSPTGKSALARYVGKDLPLRKLVNRTDVWGIFPKNKEQRFAFELLMDPSVPLVSLIGLAGSGKTLLSVAAGIQQIMEDKMYKKLIISRPIQPMGRDIGFLPGTIEEKLNPWLAPLNDNLEFLFNDDINTLEMLKERFIIQTEALTYIRGRSIPKAFIIIDECQNLSNHELKTILTRVGEGSKIVLTGDIEQIDSPYLDSVSNGLSIAVEKFKEYDLAGHVTLRAGVRSDLATLAAKIL